MNTLYITGAGVSAESSIPTFRGEDGFWSIGSRNYTPMEMATRKMYTQKPADFLAWYYHRFATYRHHGPNDVHRWLANKNLITQNIDGLDGKAGNKDYIAIHGRLDKVTTFHEQGEDTKILDAPWDKIDPNDTVNSLLEHFKIKEKPELNISLKPFVLLFDEFYTNLYRMNEAEQKMQSADKIVFMGTSFSVNITNIALNIAMNNNISVEVIDPDPVILPYKNIKYYRMTASEYISL
ncbi:NAD-dependent deacylase [Oceaniserpentilla sp. 4NH20-0058]|uniref:SIR2 family NAD-dependent protein deacylase n=1 Tax=Oceaniserpentilla sp. 4NH20-0058 TaxID=3127660 RepID=UPI00310B010E